MVYNIVIMLKKSKKRDTGCPIAYALDIFGDRWSLVIIRDILIKGFSSYSELLGSDEKIATNILANRLKDLEETGIISKDSDPNNKRYFVYTMTSMGIELAPILVEMMRWSGKYDNNTKVTNEIIDKINNNRQGFIEGIQKRLFIKT